MLVKDEINVPIALSAFRDKSDCVITIYLAFRVSVSVCRFVLVSLKQPFPQSCFSFKSGCVFFLLKCSFFCALCGFFVCLGLGFFWGGEFCLGFVAHLFVCLFVCLRLHHHHFNSLNGSWVARVNIRLLENGLI